MSKLVLLLLALVATANAGHIFGSDPELDFQNAGRASVFFFNFALESGLAANQYITLTIPSRSTVIGASPSV
jgi:hypothetical protein